MGHLVPGAAGRHTTRWGSRLDPEGVLVVFTATAVLPRPSWWTVPALALRDLPLLFEQVAGEAGAGLEPWVRAAVVGAARAFADERKLPDPAELVDAAVRLVAQVLGDDEWSAPEGLGRPQ